MKLLTISEKTAKAGYSKIGDIVGVFSDEHIFSDKEQNIFTIINIDKTEEEIYSYDPIITSGDDLYLYFTHPVEGDVRIKQNDIPSFRLNYMNGIITSNLFISSWEKVNG